MDDDVEQLLDVLRDISEVDRVEHVWKNGVYEGCLVTYANPLHPDCAVMFHPYLPLAIHGQPPERVTKEYFERHGWSVPPGADTV